MATLQLYQSLATLQTGYSRFEKDQVLNEEQLNSVTDYLDDQDRLTRINLIGTGIVCGLNVTLSGSQVKLGKGIGITTDGDLLRVDETVFGDFRAYDTSKLQYTPFTNGGSPLKLFELLPKGSGDSLSQFKATTGVELNTMGAVLLLEGYIKDDDLCSGTDCDNLGKEYVSQVKLLLTDAGSAKPLMPEIKTADAAARALNELVADRVLLSTSLSSTSQLAASYRAVCNTLHARLVAEFPKLYTNADFLLKERFTSDPSTQWISRLTAFKNQFANSDSQIQYYYGFLKDLIETWNALRAALFGEQGWCCPDVQAFPKHLWLGGLQAGSGTAQGRMSFYPAQAVRRTDGMQLALFLAEKIESMTRNFSVLSGSAAPIRITPSSTPVLALEERAIPAYYRVDSANRIEEHWNFRLHQRAMDRYNYGYHAATYGAQGTAAAPLISDIGRFDFFRIEGHLGQAARTVKAALEAEIQAKNLPFTVHAVLLGTDKSKIVKRAGIRYSDLHRLHQIVRKDVAYQMEEVGSFSESFKQQVDDAVAGDLVSDDVITNDGTTVKSLASSQNTTVVNKSKAASDTLHGGYATYKSNTRWRDDISDAMSAAGQFKYFLGKVAKTEFATPFDSLISNNHVYWLDWLDVLIQDKEDTSDDKMLFSKFMERYPGLEHAGGTTRGGTFVLVHDNNGIVIADFMLPYWYEDDSEMLSKEPELSKPTTRPGFVIKNGIKMYPSREKSIQTRLKDFKDDNDKDWTSRFDLQKTYAEAFKQSFDIYSGSLNYKTASATTGVFTDKTLGALADDVKNKRERIKIYEDKLKDKNLSVNERAFYTKEMDKTQTALSQSLESMGGYLSATNTPVTMGTEGQNALLEISSGLAALGSNATVLKAAKDSLGKVQRETANAGLKVVIGGLLG